MKIIDLRIENIGKIKLFEVHADGKNIVIGGKNGQGKSTVLQAIEMLIEGKKAFPDVPVRIGAEEGQINASLEGGFFVERTISPNGSSTLTIKNQDGARYPSPQTLLDGFRGANTLDPLAFCQLKPKDQREQLRRLVGLDFSEIEAERKTVYDSRTVDNRALAQTETRLATLRFYPDAPKERVSIEALSQQLLEVGENVRKYEQQQASLDRYFRLMDEKQAMIRALKAEIESIEKMALAVEDWLSANEKPSDTEIRDRLVDARELNSKFDANLQWNELCTQKKALSATVESKTARLEELDLMQQAALADAKFPVAGLSFGADGVLFNGIPFDQASQAEKLRVSTAMAFAANPTLKVVLICDGSLLDDDNLKLICDVAGEHNGHVWIERVGDGQECSLILEDGMIKESRVHGRKHCVETTSLAGRGQ